MKQILIKLMLIVAVLLSTPQVVRAYDFEYEGIGYTIISNADLTCRASKLVAEVTDLVIPEVVSYQDTELKVVAIDDYFAVNYDEYGIPCDSALKSVSISDGIVEIGEYAFYRCDNLESAKLPSGLKIISKYLFGACPKLSDVQFPRKVEKIREYAFSHCNLYAIELPDCVTLIEESAFEANRNLSEAKLSSSLIEIGSKAFYDCRIDSLVIPSSVEYMYSDTFDCYTETFNLTATIEKSDKELAVIVSGKRLFGGWMKMYLFRNIKPVAQKDSYDLTFYGSFAELGDGVEMTITLDVEKLIIGNGVVLQDNPGGDDLETIVIKSNTPPACPSFVEYKYLTVNVLVPKGTLSIYKNADGWQNFWHIEESDIATGISDVISESSLVPSDECGRYDLSGRKVSDDYRGVVVVKYTDGSTSKLLQQ